MCRRSYIDTEMVHVVDWLPSTLYARLARYGSLALQPTQA